MTPDYTVQLNLPARYECLGILGAVLAEMLRQVNPLPGGEQTAYNVQLAAHEVCVNIVDHAYKGMDDGRIQIVIALLETPARLVISLTDQGAWFDISAVAEPDLHNPQVRGYGLFLIRRLVDEASYERGEDGNQWRLVKYLEA